MIEKILKGMTSRIQRRMLGLLRDAPRTCAELQECLQDDLSEPGTVHVHVYNIRLKLQPYGLDICSVNRAGPAGKRENVYQLTEVSGILPLPKPSANGKK